VRLFGHGIFNHGSTPMNTDNRRAFVD
jgi:hypothetical protein